MKIKKLVSALSALTIAAGTFAGLAVTASAVSYSQNYESTAVVDWTSANTDRYIAAIRSEDENSFF